MTKKVPVMLFTFLLLALLTLTGGQRVGDTCTTPDEVRGDCIQVKKCPSLVSLLQQPRPLPQQTVQFLRDSHCGFEGRDPLACCPRRTNPTPKPTPKPRPTPGVTVPRPTGGRPMDVSRHRNVGLINDNICGVSAASRIFNGNKTKVQEFPWMVMLAYRSGSRESFRCGGTLISDRYVLTAAHCISNTNNLKLVRVRLGEHDTSKDPDCEGSDDGSSVCADPPLNIAVESTSVHPQYSTTKFFNDIALVRLASKVRFTDSVRPVCLPVGLAEQNKKLDGLKSDGKPKLLQVAGWGATENGLRSDNLLKVFLPVVANPQCASIYKTQFKFEITERQVCAGGSDKQQDSCSGDSGGPLKGFSVITPGVGPQVTQYGVVSYGPRSCGTPGVPGVYTRVGHYMEWLLDTMRP